MAELFYGPYESDMIEEAFGILNLHYSTYVVTLGVGNYPDHVSMAEVPHSPQGAYVRVTLSEALATVLRKEREKHEWVTWHRGRPLRLELIVPPGEETAETPRLLTLHEAQSLLCPQCGSTTFAQESETRPCAVTGWHNNVRYNWGETTRENDCTAVEVRCGTCRYHTFVLDNNPGGQ
jgi:hypothetical protein